jgi:hypothetical protein
MNQINERVIYTRKMAYELRKMGFKIIRVIPDEKKPYFDNYVFEDSPELQEAMRQLS